MKLLDEFKAFALKGNVVDMAVGIIIGGAFGKIVSSLVSDIIMPPIGMLIGGMNFSNLHIVLQKAHMNEATGKMPTRSISVVFIAVNRFCPATAKIVPRCVLLSAGIAVRSLFRPPEPPPASERRTEASILHIESKSIRIRLRRPFIRYESKQKDYGNDKIQGHAGTSLR